MTEQAPKSAEQFTDTSEQTRRELAAFAATANDNEIAIPRGLFTRLPGYQVDATEVVDHGCRGGWNESYTTQLGNEPVQIINVEKLNKTQVSVQLKVPGHATRPIALSVSTLGGIEFLYCSETHDNATDAELKTYLSTQPFVTLEGGQKGADWHEFVHVRAATPLAKPVSSPRPSSPYDSAKVTPLEGAFERVDAYFDTDLQQTLAQVTVSFDRSGQPVTTPWVALDTLEFYLKTEKESYAIEHALAAAATEALLRDQTHYPGAINRLLQETTLPISYPLPIDVDIARFGRVAKASFVLGSIAANDSIERMFVPTLDGSESITAPYLRAHRVGVYNKQPWVVDNTSQLATPLISPLFQAKQGIWAAPVEKIIVPEGEPAQNS